MAAAHVLAGISAALFAPGWVAQAEHSDELTVQQRQQKFWSEIEKGMKAHRSPQPASSFYSNFDQGCGLATFEQVWPQSLEGSPYISFVRA